MKSSFEMLVFVTALCVICNTSSGTDDPPEFKLNSQRSNDKIEWRIDNDVVTVVIRSPSGISNLEIVRLGETWPSKIGVQLHLKGLENLSITNAKFTLHASVSSSDGKQRLWKDKDELSQLDSKSPFYFELKMFGLDRKQTTTIPSPSSYFEFQLPKVLLEGNPKTITIRWIDFYR